MIRSFKIFISRKIIKNYAVFTLSVIGLVLLAGAVCRTTNNIDSVSLMKSLLPLYCAVTFPVTSLVNLATIFNANLKGQPYGYNYFHSLRSSVQHFWNAVIFGNILALAVIALGGAVLTVFFFDYGVITMIGMELLSLGLMNLFGLKQSFMARLLPLMALGGGVGLYLSLSDSDADFALHSSRLLIYTGLAVYALGIIYVAARAKSAWLKGGEKEKDGRTETENKAPAANANTRKIPTKPQKQSSIAFAAKSILRTPKPAAVILILLILGMAVFPYMTGRYIGGMLYYFSKAVVFLPSVTMTIFLMINISRDMLGNKLVRSLPAAKRLYTRTLPALMSTVIICSSAVFMCAYFPYLSITYPDWGLSPYSDTLLIGAMMCGTLLFFTPVFMQIATGWAVMYYISYIPAAAVIWYAVRVKELMFGFDVPMYLSVIIFLLTAALGTVWMFFYCSYRYRKKDGSFVIEQNAAVAGKQP